jgi:glycosyltransferase involved in cell wall biosynthesis
MGVDLPGVSVVVIGRNEEENLSECFRSIFAIDYPPEKLEVIYVDTGSSDGSLEIARKFGVKIAEEFSEFPTPGLARNRGIEEAKHEIIHFVDGDMTLDNEYLKHAVKILGEDNIACVIGRVSERNARSNFFSRVLSYPWQKRQTGYINAPGAGGTFLKHVLIKLGGYNSGIRCGEETELGFRVIQAGYKIYMIGCDMGTHDYGINNMFDLFAQSFTMGKSFGKMLILPAMPSYRDLRMHAKNVLIQGIFALAVAVFVILIKQAEFLLVTPIILIVYVIIRYRKEYASQQDRYVLFYYMFMHLCKPVVFSGVLVYLFRYSAKKCSRLIRLKDICRK